jgi:hypothetical protein
VTLIAHGDGYAPGAEALGASLASSGSAVPRVAMVTADVPDHSRAALVRCGFSLREVAPIENPHPAGDHLYPRFASVLTKRRMMVSGGASLWWDIYYAAHPERDRRWRRRLHRLQDHLFGRIVHLLGA